MSPSKSFSLRCVFVLLALLHAPSYVVIYGTVSNSPSIGLIMAGVRTVSNIAEIVVMPNIESVPYKVIIAELSQNLWHHVQAVTRNHLIFLCAILVSFYPLLLFPIMGTDFFFQSRRITYILTWYTACAFPFVEVLMRGGLTYLTDPLLTHAGKVLQMYCSFYTKVVQNLVRSRAYKSRVMARIDVEQQVIETFARRLNEKQRFFVGVKILTLLCWVALCMIGLIFVEIHSPESIAIILIIVIYASVSTYLLASTLSQVSHTWVVLRQQHLSMPKVGNRVGELFGTYSEFKAFLRDHECSALRVFFFRVTDEFMNRLLGGLLSMMALLCYLAVRNILFQL